MTANPALIQQLAVTQRAIPHALRHLTATVAAFAEAAEAQRQALDRIADPADATTALDSACYSIDLHGNARWLTQSVTTDEREAFADACDRHRAAWPADEQFTPFARWWRDNPTEPERESVGRPG